MSSTSTRKKAGRATGGGGNKRTTTTTTTIQVKVGNHVAPPMTPNEAAEYLKTLSSTTSTTGCTSSLLSSLTPPILSNELQMIVENHSHPSLLLDPEANQAANAAAQTTMAAMMESYRQLLTATTTTTTSAATAVPLVSSSWDSPSKYPMSNGGGGGGATGSSSSNNHSSSNNTKSSLKTPPVSSPEVDLPVPMRRTAQAAFAANGGPIQPTPLYDNNNNNNVNLPCSEKEMKALMSMFVEIMSLQMNTDRLNQGYTATPAITTTTGPTTTTTTPRTKSKKRTTAAGPMFQFPTNVPPPPPGWPECLAWPPVYELRGHPGSTDTEHDIHNDDDNDNDDDDSLPALEPIPVEDRARMIQYAQESQQPAALRAAETTAATVRHGRSAMDHSISGPEQQQLYQYNTYVPLPPVPGSTIPLLDVTGPVTGSGGIVPMEWSMIERMVIEDAMEQEELLSMRLRKVKNDPKKKEPKKKKSPPPQMFPAPLPPEIASRTAASITSQEATLALQKVEEANRKLSKAVTMWRNRVATAVTQNELSKLELLLHESPLRTVTHMQQQAASVLSFHNNMNHHPPGGGTGNQNNNNNNSSSSNPASLNHAMLGQGMNGVETVDDHLRYLVPLTVPKNFAALKSQHSNSVARKLLAQYIVSEFSPNHFVIPGQNGRSILHMACMMADLSILKLILDHAKQTLHPSIVCEVLMKRCHDSGWNAFHYAISSGSLRVIEAILQSLTGENELIQKLITSLTNDTLTWKRGETVGISPQFLACSLLSYHPETRIETHGMALQEIVNHRIRQKTVGNHATIDPTWYVAYLTQIAICLTLIQANGHVALDEAEILRIERDTIQQLEESQLRERTNAATAAYQNINEEDDKWMDSDEETSPTTTVEKKKNNNNKKKKKKNKALPSTVAGAPASVSVSSKDHNNNNKVAPDQDPSDRDVTSVEESSQFSKPTATTELSNADPLVSALEGMGFEKGAILDGIKACGGSSRATADDVVAWIFGGGGGVGLDDTIETTIRTEPDEKVTIKTTSTVPKVKVAVAVNEKEQQELRRKEEDERMAAEKLAAKREEQRRRNREWNSRAQARQIQETQEKIAKSAAVTPTTSSVSTPAVLNPQASFGSSTQRSGILPSTPISILQHNNNNNNAITNSVGTAGVHGPSTSNYHATSMGFDPMTLSATPSRMAISAANRTAGRLNLAPSATDNAYYDNGYGNDGSTIASSVDHGIIDIGGNDDATVSTIGSFPAVYPPTPASQAPPGFSSGPILPAMDGVGHQPQHRGITQAQWEAHRSLSMNDSYALNNHGTYNHSIGMSGLGVTSMIPESSPLPSHHRSFYDDIGAPSLNLPSQSNTLPSAFGSFSGTSTDFAPGNSSLFGGGSTTLMRNDGGTAQYGNDISGLGNPLGYSMSSFRSNPLDRSISAPVSSSYLNDTNSHSISGLFGFGSDLNQKAIDSTIIDSISTGNTGIGGSALWGSPPETQTTGGGTSSLLGNLILNATTSSSKPNDYSPPPPQQRENPLFSNGLESQFPETSFLSKDAVAWDRNRLPNNLPSSHESTHGSSIW